MKLISLFALILVFYIMVDNVGFWRAILNDPNYWIPATVILFSLAYMVGRFIYIEKQSPPKIENQSEVKDLLDSSKIKKEIAMEDRSKSTGDTYNVTSHGQQGGVTTGKGAA